MQVRNALETDTLNQIRKWARVRTDVRLKRNHGGFDQRAKLVYGLGKGSPDLVGVTRCGRVIAIEVKSPTGRVSDDQRAWLASFEAWGGRWCIARSLRDAINFVESL